MQSLDIKLVNSLRTNIEESVADDDIGSHIDYLAELATDKDILEGNYETEGDDNNESE